MSQSFALVNGDLVVSGGRAFQIVKNRDKLVQDLKLWILEKYGLDPNTPEYGSQLDTYIGTIISQEAINNVQAEIMRVLQQYQTIQISNMQRETVVNAGTTTLDPSEVITSIDSVDIRSIATMLLITVSLSTLDENQLNLSIPINTNAQYINRVLTTDDFAD